MKITLGSNFEAIFERKQKDIEIHVYISRTAITEFVVKNKAIFILCPMYVY